jgi:hypothetical protein
MDRLTSDILDSILGRFGTGRDEFANSLAFKPEDPSRGVLAVIGKRRSFEIKRDD